MKKNKLVKKTLSLSKQTIRVLTDHQLDGVAGGFNFPTTDPNCETAGKVWSCVLC
jgi:hypothetical protein